MEIHFPTPPFLLLKKNTHIWWWHDFMQKPNDIKHSLILSITVKKGKCWAGLHWSYLRFLPALHLHWIVSMLHWHCTAYIMCLLGPEWSSGSLLWHLNRAFNPYPPTPNSPSFSIPFLLIPFLLLPFVFLFVIMIAFSLIIVFLIIILVFLALKCLSLCQ